jgi:hypothetical protein
MTTFQLKIDHQDQQLYSTLELSKKFVYKKKPRENLLKIEFNTSKGANGSFDAI